MMHAQNNMKGTAYILHSLLNDFSMFKVRIWYEKNTVHKNIPDYLVIKYINWGKTIGCTSDNIPIGYFIAVLVTNVVFENIGLSCII